ncbi:MAG: VOC family protein [Pseudomonadota bacterium]
MLQKNALDHVVVGVPDLASARGRLEALGFQVQADAHHPFGTGNCNVFFENGTYFEPLAITDRDAELAALKAANPFVQKFDAYRFRHGYGPLMAAFTTDSAESMNALLASHGKSAGDILSFIRDQALPDGSMTSIGVHLALAADEWAPDITLFTCEHLSRDILWRPERVVHLNGIVGISRLIAVETNPSDFQYLFQTITGDRDLRTTSAGMEMDLPNAHVSVLTPTAYAAITGLDIEERGRGPRIEAAELEVKNIGAFKTHLDEASILYREIADTLIIDRLEAFPITLIIRAAD